MFALWQAEHKKEKRNGYFYITREKKRIRCLVVAVLGSFGVFYVG